jgi:hypothetical protein
LSREKRSGRIIAPPSADANANAKKGTRNEKKDKNQIEERAT